MQISNETRWAEYREKNKDPYGGAVIHYAESWADLMEKNLNGHEPVGHQDFVNRARPEETSHKADVEGITGFMYGAAVMTLAEVWKYGDMLRRWHNLDTQIGHEGERANEQGGVLNPALLSFEVKE